MTYLVANLIGWAVWLFFFITRKDLRKEMVVMGLIFAPLSFLDLLFVPSYWVPETIFNFPIGIEGFMYSFQVGGVAAVVYEYFDNKKLVKIKNYHLPVLSIIILLLLAPAAYTLTRLYNLNIAIGIYIASLVGILIIIHARKDLIRSTILGGVSYGIVYFASLAIWFNLYPEAQDWFVLENLPRTFILGVPIYEILFGILLGAYWGNIYEFLFGYKYSDRKKR